MSTKPFYSPAQLEQGIKLGHILESLDPSEKQDALAAIKGQLEILADTYTPGDVTRNALKLAILSVSMAINSIGLNHNGCQKDMSLIDGIVQSLSEYFFAAIVEETPTDYELVYPPQFCDCGCTNEFGDKIGVPCMADDLPLPSLTPEWLEAA